MSSLSRRIINSRSDLDTLKGTPEYNEFMRMLKGSMTCRKNVQVYPEGYGQPDYEGETLEPIWEDVEDLSTITRFGFKKADLNSF
jgi:hypothetical protein